MKSGQGDHQKGKYTLDKNVTAEVAYFDGKGVKGIKQDLNMFYGGLNFGF